MAYTNLMKNIVETGVLKGVFCDFLFFYVNFKLIFTVNTDTMIAI